MKSNKRLVDFKDAFDIVKKYAKEHCEGNFSMAVRKLVKRGAENATTNTNTNANQAS